MFWRGKQKFLPGSLKNPQIIVKKRERKLELLDDGRLIKTYKIALGFEPANDKIKRDDGRTPEGEYFVAVKNPASKFHRSLGLNYPNSKDAARGLRDNLISQSEYEGIIAANLEKRMPPQNTALGGEIYLHGGGTLWDWTWGCVALDNQEMQELFEIIPLGARVTIEP